MDYLTPAEFLARGFGLPPLETPPTPLPEGGFCAITGQPITVGYPVADMVTDATAEFLDGFRGGLGGHVAEAAARCFKSSNPRMGNPCARPVMIYEDATCYMPTIARDSSATLPRVLQETGSPVTRPAWSDLVRDVWPERAGQRVLIMLSTDTKKRLWIRARVGALGSRTPVLYYDAATGGDRTLFVAWPRLLACLDLVEEVYTAGFPKTALREGLAMAFRVALRAGLGRTQRWERKLATWRGSDEFRMAALIAQKQEEAFDD